MRCIAFYPFRPISLSLKCLTVGGKPFWVHNAITTTDILDRIHLAEKSQTLLLRQPFIFLKAARWYQSTCRAATQVMSLPANQKTTIMRAAKWLPVPICWLPILTVKYAPVPDEITRGNHMRPSGWVKSRIHINRVVEVAEISRVTKEQGQFLLY